MPPTRFPGDSSAADAAANAAVAKESIERLEKGEDVTGSMGKPMTAKDMRRMLREWGWAKRDMEHPADLASLSQQGFEAFMEAAGPRCPRHNQARPIARWLSLGANRDVGGRDKPRP